MSPDLLRGQLKIVRGSGLPLVLTNVEATCDEILNAAVAKHRALDQNFRDGDYYLLYPDMTKVHFIPGTQELFNLKSYKEACGKPYRRIVLCLCLQTEFQKNENPTVEISDSDSEVILKHTENDDLDETLPWKQGASNQAEADRSAQQSSSHTVDMRPQGSSSNIYYRNYTEEFAPIPLSDDSSVEDTEETVIGDRAQESHITISNIIEDLFLQVNNAACSRFIINRADVWDGAMRGFRRSNCEPQNSIMVKFTDDIGVTEEGIDTGGPKREFLGLLMDHLHKRPIFEGPETQRFLKCDATGEKNDEYFMAGRVIAVSLVHGGPSHETHPGH